MGEGGVRWVGGEAGAVLIVTSSWVPKRVSYRFVLQVVSLSLSLPLSLRLSVFSPHLSSYLLSASSLSLVYVHARVDDGKIFLSSFLTYEYMSLSPLIISIRLSRVKAFHCRTVILYCRMTTE